MDSALGLIGSALAGGVKGFGEGLAYVGKQGMEADLEKEKMKLKEEMEPRIEEEKFRRSESRQSDIGRKIDTDSQAEMMKRRQSEAKRAAGMADNAPDMATADLDVYAPMAKNGIIYAKKDVAERMGKFDVAKQYASEIDKQEDNERNDRTTTRQEKLTEAQIETEKMKQQNYGAMIEGAGRYTPKGTGGSASKKLDPIDAKRLSEAGKTIDALNKIKLEGDGTLQPHQEAALWEARSTQAKIVARHNGLTTEMAKQDLIAGNFDPKQAAAYDALVGERGAAEKLKAQSGNKGSSADRPKKEEGDLVPAKGGASSNKPHASERIASSKESDDVDAEGVPLWDTGMYKRIARDIKAGRDVSKKDMDWYRDKYEKQKQWKKDFR